MSVLAEAQRSSRGTSLRLGKAILGQLGVPRRQNASGHEFRRFGGSGVWKRGKA